MAIPKFEALALPLLKIASDGQEHNMTEVREALAVQLGLTDEERKELLPSGRQARYDNRVAWARVHLGGAGLLESTGRGRFCITEKGLKVLNSNPAALTVKFLSQFPEYMEFRKGTQRSEVEDTQNDKEETDQTPEEILESGYQGLRRALAQELLERIKKCSPQFFEKLVVDLLVTMGYGGSRKDAGQAVGQSGDGGIDGIIKEDKLGLDVVYIQAKRWDGTVGRPIVQAFAGSLEGQRARKGVLITTSQFSQEARDYVTRIEKKIVLIDGEQLIQLLIDHNMGVSEVATYTVKKLDLDYFSDEQ